MNKDYQDEFFAQKPSVAKQVARTSGNGYKIFEYAIWDKQNKKLKYVRYQDMDKEKDMFDVLDTNAPQESHDKYVLAHMAHPDTPHAGDWMSCPIDFSVKRGIQNKSAILYSNKTSYEDCSDKSGVKELKANTSKIMDRTTSDIFEQAIVDQLQSTDVKHFQVKLAPNAKIYHATNKKRLLRILPKLEKACGKVKSEKIRGAFADYVNLVKKFYRIEKPRSKGKESKSGQK